jgi:hypothetical protein
MSGDLTRACATATALLVLLFFFAITFGAFSPPARPMAERPLVAKGQQ